MIRNRCFFAIMMAVVAFSWAISAKAQPPVEQVEVEIETPKGWRTETLKLPTGFAPDMKWTGFEEVRFAPGMFRPDSESFFSYLFVFCLPNQSPPDSKTMTTELLKYYRGLAVAVTKGRDVDVKPKSFTLKLTPMKDSKTKLLGVLTWVEPFATLKSQTLNLEIESVEEDSIKGTLLKVAVSPQPHDVPLWKQMREMLKAAKVHTSERP